MRRALWLLPFLAGLAGWLFARRSDRAALPGAINRALEPARTKPRPAETAAASPRREGLSSAPKRARLPWSHHPE